MAQPLPSSNRKPLRDYLKAAQPTEREILAILKDASEEAERLIPKYAEQSGGVRSAQLTVILRELKSMQSAMWGDIGRTLRDGVAEVTEAAWVQAQDVLLDYLRANGQDPTLFLESFRQSARDGLGKVLAKSANGIPLSSAVYRSQALAQGWVDRAVRNGILLQKSAKEIAKDVSGFIDPAVPGGVSYAAMRLARTELNNAFKTAQERRYEDEPWTTGMRWNLSGSHPKRDECNDYAEQDEHGLGAGVYPVGQRPHSHPNCLCYLTPEQADEDAFIEGFLNGDYDDHLGEVVGEAEVVELHQNLGGAKKAPVVRPRADGTDLTQWAIDNTRDGNQDTPLNSPGEFSDPRDRTLAVIGKEQGFDGLPSVGGVDQALEEGGVEMWRGVVPFSGKAGGLSGKPGKDASKARSSEEIIDGFRGGTYEPGTGIYGNGFYFSVSKRVAEHFAEPKPKKPVGGKAFRAVLRAGARVVEYDDLLEEMREWKTRLASDTVDLSELFKLNFVAPPGKVNPNLLDYVAADPGRFAAMMGYDAIRVVGQQDGAPYVKGEPSARNGMGARFSAHEQYVILNRTALVMEES